MAAKFFTFIFLYVYCVHCCLMCDDALSHSHDRGGNVVVILPQLFMLTVN